MASGIDIPNKHELEKYLGNQTKLDGSWSSIWALEYLVTVVREHPRWFEHIQWAPAYLAQIIKRAWEDMGLQVLEPEPGVLKTALYEQNINRDFEKLLQPADRIPTFFHSYWSKRPVFGLAYLPHYAKAVLYQNQEWAKGKLQNLYLNQSHNEKSTQWLISEFKSQTFHPAEYGEETNRVLKAILWPPFPSKDNEDGRLNLNSLQNLFLAPQANYQIFCEVLLSLVTNQDLFVSVLASAACFQLQIAPTNPDEACALQRAQGYFRQLPESLDPDGQERILEVIKMLAVTNETPATGSNHPDFIEALKLANQQKYNQATVTLTELIQSAGEQALYFRMRGRMFEKQGKRLHAFDDYNRAIRLKNDFWQAYVNRASLYVKEKEFEKAHQDFLKACQIRPSCQSTRENLLRLYFHRLSIQK
ncbi:MAG: hypothetical protein H7A33_04620 [Deltaproteobacteria bacterium]|nr:hypothetical protein [Deltaproteobacteria bacterium]